MTDVAISVLHATQNNLKDVSVEIAFGQLICVTGVSGSGKSTFVDRCIGELAQHRHLALSGKTPSNYYEDGAYSNQVPFASYIKQGALGVSNRSVVGTALGVIQKLRELIIPYAEVRDGKGHVLGPLNAVELVQWCQRHHIKAQLSLAVCLEHMVLGPASRYIKPALQTFPECSFKVIDAEMPYEHSDLHIAGKYLGSVFRTHKDIYAVIPKLTASQGQQLGSAFERVMAAYPGHDLILTVETKQQTEVINLTNALLSPTEPLVYYQPSEALLSFNSHARISGQCQVCKGTGRQVTISREAVFAGHSTPVSSGGLGLSFNNKTGEYLYFPALCDEIRGVLRAQGEALTAIWTQLRSDTCEILAMGSIESFQPFSADGKPKGKKKSFTGLMQRIENKLNGSSSAVQGLSHLRSDNECQACGGTRLNHAARAVYYTGCFYPELMNLTLSEAQSWLHSLLANKELKAAKSVITALIAVCQSCVDMGLGHLRLSRATNTLSGGEAQRLRIARGLWARLDHACYVVDEPARGLHTKDVLGVIRVFDKLRTPQNCVLLVDHNPFLVSHADRVIELGPNGGTGGGEVVYDGPASGCSMLDNSVRAPVLDGACDPRGWITVTNANLRTVVHQSFKLPLGNMTCFTGVSGSGKTTLLAGVLMPALEQLQNGLGRVVSQAGDVVCDGVTSFRLVYLSQSTIGGSFRSRVLTHLGLADLFRDWFCDQSDAATSGMTASHFSSNTQEGQCLTCQGSGRVQSATDSHEACPSCCASGFNPDASFVRAHERTVTEWMDCSLAELANSVELPDMVSRAAGLANELGLGHLSLGRSIPSLSGGECQRLRIVKALLDAGGHKKEGVQQHLVIVMDEPAAGLHLKDVQHLITSLKKNITDKGHTLLLIEHNLQLIGYADWIVDVGPGSAAHGGQVLFAGSLADFLRANLNSSPTYLALKGRLAKEPDKYADQPPALVKNSSESSKLEVVSRFKHYLQGENESTDKVESVIQPIEPAYAFSMNELSNRTFAHASGMDGQLFRLFAAESICKQHPILTGLDELEVMALTLLQAKWRIGWFPTPAGREVAAWPDTIESIKAHLRRQGGDWFDGQNISTKSPAVGRPLALGKLRLLVASKFEPREAVRRAIALGKGWVSLVCAETGEVRDLSIRAIDHQHLRLGSRWKMPHIFDASYALHACPLCNGEGFMESIDQRLIFKDRSMSLDSDELFQPYALEVLRLLRRQELMPAAKRLKESALMDLTSPLNAMNSTLATAFWFGYPHKSFLKTGGQKNVMGDWYRWQGINKSVLLNMWKCSSREWATNVNASRIQVSCPECEGTGLGWEARQRVIAGVSMQEIYLNYSGKQLKEWLDNLHIRDVGARKIQKNLNMLIERVTNMTHCDFRLFDQLKHLPDQVQQAAMCIYLSNHALNHASIYIEGNSESNNGKLKNMLAKSKATSMMKLVLD